MSVVFVPDADEIRDCLDRGWSVADVAAWAGCSPRSVRNVANDAGLVLPQARRRAERAGVLADGQQLAALLDAGSSPSDIAGSLNVPLRRVRDALASHGLGWTSRHGQVVYAQLYEDDWLAERLRRRQSLKSIAVEVGCSLTAIRRAIDVLGITDRDGRDAPSYPQLTDEAWLRERYVERKLSATAIAGEVGCAEQTVRNALRRAGIMKRTRHLDQRLTDSAWLRQRVVVDSTSPTRLSREIGCSANTVYRALARAGIKLKRRGPLRYPRLHSRTWLRRAYVTERMSTRAIAQELGCSEQTVRDALRRAGIEIRTTRSPAAPATSSTAIRSSHGSQSRPTSDTDLQP